MQIGLLGKANVGKSTFFSAATHTSVASGNFPFTTIEPNVGVAFVRAGCACKHFGIKHDLDLCMDGTRMVPVKLIDIAGLVPGAHEGKGLGNQFLDDARQAMALVHVVDAAGTTDIQGQPVPAGTHDPVEDVAFVRDEFDEWFADILTREWDKIAREIDQKRAKLADGIAKRFTGLGIRDYQIQGVLQSLSLASRHPKQWDDADIRAFVRQLRAETKPMIIAANKADLCDDPDAVIKRIESEAGDDNNNNDNNNNDDTSDAPKTIVVPCSAETELLLGKASKAGIIEYVAGGSGFTVRQGADISEQQRKALDLVRSVFSKIPSTGVQSVLDAIVFDLLKFIVVYPVEDEARLTNKDGVVLPDPKLVARGSTAKDLAAIVHADIAKGFLHAIDCKTKQRIGADHVLKEGDVIKIVSTQSRG